MSNFWPYITKNKRRSQETAVIKIEQEQKSIYQSDDDEHDSGSAKVSDLLVEDESGEDGGEDHVRPSQHLITEKYLGIN